jgi:hypothetical protein
MIFFVGFCKRTFGSINCEEFLDQLRHSKLFKKDSISWNLLKRFHEVDINLFRIQWLGILH